VLFQKLSGMQDQRPLLFSQPELSRAAISTGPLATGLLGLLAAIRSASTSSAVRCSRVRSSAFGRRSGVTVRFPSLDEAVMNTNEAWAAKLRARNIGDFRKWKDHDTYKQGAARPNEATGSEAGSLGKAGWGPSVGNARTSAAPKLAAIIPPTK
jgi:hypothetical protein